MARTGRGLALGQTVADIDRIYGRRWGRQGNDITIQWQDLTELRIKLADGKIVQMMLVADIE